MKKRTFLTVSEAARQVGCTPQNIYHMLTKGILTPYKKRGVTYVDYREIKKYYEEFVEVKKD